MLTELLGDAAADRARGWDGDRYALLRGADQRQALVWFSVWDDAASADAFAETYRAADRARSVERIEVDGRPMVRVVIADAADAAAAAPGVAALRTTPGGTAGGD